MKLQKLTIPEDQLYVATSYPPEVGFYIVNEANVFYRGSGAFVLMLESVEVFELAVNKLLEDPETPDPKTRMISEDYSLRVLSIVLNKESFNGVTSKAK